jgi:sporulation protein YunB
LGIIIRNTLINAVFNLAEAEVINNANKIISEVIEAEFKDVKYQDLISYESNKNGDIILMQANVQKINDISSKVSLNINNKLEQIDGLKVRVPILKALGFDILAGIGPDFMVKVIPVGFMQPPQLNDSFESAGINQTRHKIYLMLDLKMKLLVPFSREITHVKAQLPVIEATILGKVPEVYIGIDGNSMDGIIESDIKKK